MKSLLTFFILPVALYHVFGIYAVGGVKPPITMTVFYETLCFDNLNYFEEIIKILESNTINHFVILELVPFGKGRFGKTPYDVYCHHGSAECYGNVMNACFVAKESDQLKQALFVDCVMRSGYPPHGGETCAQKLGYNYDGIHECTHNREGAELQRKNGRRTLDFRPKITHFPAVAFDNVLVTEKDSKVDLQAILLEKLEAKGVNVYAK